jgi:hypothetical protein
MRLANGTVLTVSAPDQVSYFAAPGASRVTKPAITTHIAAATALDPGQCVINPSSSSHQHIELFYAHFAGQPDNYAVDAASIQQQFRDVDSLFINYQAEHYFGVNEHLWVQCDNGGDPVVHDIALSATLGSSNFGTIVTDMSNDGYSLNNVHYWIWTDGNPTVGYAGQSTLYADDSPGVSNANNQWGAYSINYGYSSTNTDCGEADCGALYFAHENGHAMGAVQLSAPDTTGAYHCIDGNDVMCYNDGGPYASAFTTLNCGNAADGVRYFDCNFNDYFNPNPAVGSYLATHWNLGSVNNQWMAIVKLPTVPAITSISHSSGPIEGGQIVTVNGSGFLFGMTVSIGGVAATPMSVTPTSFTFITPAENAGLVDIQVTTVIGTSLLTVADEYTYGSLPVISSVSPTGGVVSGGQTVTVTGSGFTPGMTATIGGTAVTPSGVAATSFTFTAPAEAAGVVQVQVTTVIGASVLSGADDYAYSSLPVINAVTPSAGPVTGGQVVTVTGSGFVAGMTATIGGAAVTPTGITASSFSFTTPAESAGYDQVQVTNLAASSALTPAAGYIYSGLGSYVPLTPFRIMDTRSGHCGVHTCGALGAGQTLPLQITGYSVPANATAVVLNVLAVNGSASSLLTVYPNGTGRPLASNLNFTAHENIANLVTVALGQTGASDSQREVNLYNAVGTVNVVVDVEGYFVPQASSNPAGEFHAIAPLRVCDTRAKQPANGCNQGHSTDNQIGPGQVLKVNVSGIPSGVGGATASIPTNGTAGAAVLNLTAVAGTQATWLSVFPTQSNGTCLTSAPGSSTINVSAGGVLANRVMVPLGPSHSGGPGTDVCVYNAAGTINVLLDASGWFGSTTGSPPTGAQYQAIGPTRICDTRRGTGTECSGHQLTSGGTLLVAVAGVGGIPGSGPVAIIANLTAVGGSQPTYLTVYPADVSSKPNASDLNLNPGMALPNLVVVGLASGAPVGALNLFNAMGSINAVLDVDGWFQ